MSQSVTIKSLTKAYKTSRQEVTAVGNLDLKVDAGEVLVLLGASGCGKTTVLRCVAGLEAPDGGSIEIGPTTVYSARSRRFVPPERRNLGMVFQSYAIWPHMTVGDNVAYPLKRHGVEGKAVKTRVSEALERVGCEELRDRYGKELSGGQQQRVALARAIVGEPALLLMDEPLSNLDASLRERLRLEISELVRSLQITIIYVTHDQSEAMSMADRVAVMESGRISQLGPPTDLYAHPNSLGVARALGSVNSIPVTASYVAADDQVIVEAAWGAIRMPAQEAHKKLQHRPAMMMFRPHHIQFRKPSERALQFRARLKQYAYTGESISALLEAGGTSLRATWAPDVMPCLSNDTDLELYLDPRDIALFPDPAGTAKSGAAAAGAQP